MKNIKIQIALMLILLTGCDSFVEVGLPDSQLTGHAVYEDPHTATAALMNIYSKLRDTGILSGSLSGSPTQLGLYSDELTYANTGASMLSVYNNSLLPSSALVTQLWNESYHQIYCANAVMEGVQNSASLDEEQRSVFTGEALFIRALVHFYLVNVYGEIPYITTTDFEQNKLAPRMPEAEVYEMIEADLEEAIALLPEDYVTAERVRPNKSAAWALLARNYLYMARWPEAANAASAVINNPTYVWEPDLDKIFLKESTTTIWQLKPALPGSNANEGAAFIFVNGPPVNTSVSPQLLASFEPGDARRAHWIKCVTNGTNTWCHAYKYKANGNTGTSAYYSIQFRLAEQYLIRAEARARQGEITGALDDLNRIRNNSGLPDSVAETPTQIIAAIMEERRHELFTEYGHRFFDLKRSGQIDAVLSPVKPGWDTTDRLWPLPERELLSNPNLTPQNPGY